MRTAALTTSFFLEMESSKAAWMSSSSYSSEMTLSIGQEAEAALMHSGKIYR